MKKLILSLMIFLPVMFGLSVVTPAFAQEFNPLDEACKQFPDPNDPNRPSTCDDNELGQTTNPISGPNGILLRAGSILAWVIGAASVIMIIIGGIKYVTSSGDTNSVNSAKQTILYAAIGVVVSLMAQGIIYFVIKRLE